MRLSTQLVCLFLSAASLVQALPLSRRDINISHKSLVNGTSSTHSIDSSLLPAELAAALEGSDININLTTDRRKRSPLPASGVNNSTINLTVIGSRSLPLPNRKLLADEIRRQRSLEKRATKSTATHHNIHIDASSNGQGGVGGIHNSTVNINLNSNSKKERRKVQLGDHSVIVDVSSSSSSTSSPSAGIEDSTVHVNILPARALSKSTGHHSIVVDSSSFDSNDETSTSTGTHSAIVDTSSSSSTNDTTSSSTGIKSSTINLTVISPSSDDTTSSSPSTDSIESPIPSMARLSKRSSTDAAAFAAWSEKVQRAPINQMYQSELDTLAAIAEADAGFSSMMRRDHSSHRI